MEDTEETLEVGLGQELGGLRPFLGFRRPSFLLACWQTQRNSA
jgi:hypothetical protein